MKNLAQLQVSIVFQAQDYLKSKSSTETQGSFLMAAHSAATKS